MGDEVGEQARQSAGRGFVFREVDLRVRWVDAAEEALAFHDFLVKELVPVRLMGGPALGIDGVAALGFLLSLQLEEILGEFVERRRSREVGSESRFGGGCGLTLRSEKRHLQLRLGTERRSWRVREPAQH